MPNKDLIKIYNCAQRLDCEGFPHDSGGELCGWLSCGPWYEADIWCYFWHNPLECVRLILFDDAMGFVLPKNF